MTTTTIIIVVLKHARMCSFNFSSSTLIQVSLLSLSHQLFSSSSSSFLFYALSSCVIGPISVYFFTFGCIHAFSLYFFLSLFILYPAVRYSLLAHQYLIRSELSKNTLTQFLIHVHINIHIYRDRKGRHYYTRPENMHSKCTW